MIILTVNLLFSTLVFWIAYAIYLKPRMSDLAARAIVIPILLLHALRHLGLMFLAPGVTHPNLPAQFAYPAAFGDLLTAVLALIALVAIVRNSTFARPLVGLFTIVGSVDLANAIALSIVNDASPYMGAAYWIPAFWVPALLVTHYVVFVLLGKRWTGAM